MELLTLVLFLTFVVIALYYLYHNSSWNSSNNQDELSMKIDPKKAFKLKDIVPYEISYNYSIGTGPGLYGRGRHENSLNF